MKGVKRAYPSQSTIIDNCSLLAAFLVSPTDRESRSMMDLNIFGQSVSIKIPIHLRQRLSLMELAL